MSDQPRKSTKGQRANRDAIVYPLRGIQTLLRAHKYGQKDLNLGSVHRNLEWCWSTYEFLYHDLGIFQDEVTKLIKETEDVVQEFNFSEAKYTEDGYTEARRFYENAMEES